MADPFFALQSCDHLPSSSRDIQPLQQPEGKETLQAVATLRLVNAAPLYLSVFRFGIYLEIGLTRLVDAS